MLIDTTLHGYYIIINAIGEIWHNNEIRYDEIVKLTFSCPVDCLFSITYRRGHCDKPTGILSKGESIEVKEGMIFDVIAL